MTNDQKIEKLKVLISPDTATNELLLSLLEQSEGIILNRRYPFGAPEGATLSAFHQQIQLRIAVELFNKMGAEGQTDHDENGYMFTRIKTTGKKLDKIVLESKFTTVLLSKCVDGRYLFETQARNSTAKSPLGAFEEFEIDNDITKVIKALEEY